MNRENKIEGTNDKQCRRKKVKETVSERKLELHVIKLAKKQTKDREMREEVRGRPIWIAGLTPLYRSKNWNRAEQKIQKERNERFGS